MKGREKYFTRGIQRTNNLQRHDRHGIHGGVSKYRTFLKEIETILSTIACATRTHL